MFVTCLYAVLEPDTGELRFANAGHNLPFRRTATGAQELLVRGMPLGLMPDMEYEEQALTLQPGDCLLLYSDGLVEAHNPARAMFGSHRVRDQVAAAAGREKALIGSLLSELYGFTGASWEQEDDITLVMLHRAPTRSR
jgi:serine phosphatase RsbU (regulator of sigma subunit)